MAGNHSILGRLSLSGGVARDRARSGAGLHVDARRQRRRLPLRRAADDRERHRATGKDHHGQSRDQQGALAAPLRSAGLLKRMRQPGDDLLRGGQLLRQRLLGGLQIARQPALVVTATQSRRAGLRRVSAQPDNAAGDVYRPDRRIGQATG
jgi:hypothetical protein